MISYYETNRVFFHIIFDSILYIPNLLYSYGLIVHSSQHLFQLFNMVWMSFIFIFEIFCLFTFASFLPTGSTCTNTLNLCIYVILLFIQWSDAFIYPIMNFFFLCSLWINFLFLFKSLIRILFCFDFTLKCFIFVHLLR